ncbi:unnamed protein product [Orchesella dallaii]|uniref:STE20-like serine/threonine-protein kinase n=1 Tax=Orchesella dallaii TaxID=48710 RepID=A0ABP1PU39_9HEXA
MALDAQEKNFEQEKMALVRDFESEMEAKLITQKYLVAKTEHQQENELGQTSRWIRADQQREMRLFREDLQQEVRLLRQEIGEMHEDARESTWRSRKEQLDRDQHNRERQFLEKLNESHDSRMKRENEIHRSRIASMERQFLEEKHERIRRHNKALWDLEDSYLKERHQFKTRQIKESFHLQRQQMLIRQEEELEHHRRVSSRKEDELLKRQAAEKRALPNRIRSEMKIREAIFRESLRIHAPGSNPATGPEDEKDRLRKFQEQEKKKYKAEQQRLDDKHIRQLEEMRGSSEAAKRELEQLQNEKRALLTQHEEMKLKEPDELFFQHLKAFGSKSPAEFEPVFKIKPAIISCIPSESDRKNTNLLQSEVPTSSWFDSN